MSLHVCVDSSAVVSGLSTLYTNQQLTDVRIVCFDGYLLAHKVVLAAVSDKFREMLSSDTSMASNLSMIILADISVEDIKSIIDCIYCGQQKIESKRFKQLVAIADNFGIKLVSAVSAAIASSHAIHTSTPMPSKASADPTTAHNIGVAPNRSLKPKSLLQTKQRTQLSAGESGSQEEIPMDLSMASKVNSAEDNVQKIIDSIATNGPQTDETYVRPQTPFNRRRKQSDPKPALLKMVRFDEIAQEFEAEPIHESMADDDSFDAMTAEDMTAFNNFANKFGDISAQTSTVSTTECQSIGQTLEEDRTQSTIVSKSDMSLEFPNGSNSCPNSATKGKPGRSPGKSMLFIEDQLMECCVCGKSPLTYKQVISHLNREHKTYDYFKCGVCGKEQKYAKSFLVHSLQCQTPKA